MVQQVTNGIKVSVKTRFIDTRYQNKQLNYLFSYQVTIENLGNETVQLISRHWDIFDSLNKKEVVEGEGVIGEQPIIAKNGIHIYNSFCSLVSPIGSMGGFFNMIIANTNQNFKVIIPTFQLIIKEIHN